MQNTLDKNAKLFMGYIKDKKVLVADKSSGARTGLAKTMISIGANPGNVILADSYEQAEEELKSKNPHVVVCDYDLGKRCGLELLQQQRLNHPESKNCLFILVTGNTSQSAVAQAAEEDVDTFVLKPYTLDVLRNSILKAAIAKIYPSDYIKMIDEGKKLLIAGNAEEALKTFEIAKTLDPKPALACFYHGQAQMMKEAIDSAAGDYNQGLNYNKIHYKCLTGLFDILMSKKMHKDAYDVVKRIARYFPANPQRLAQVLKLAIINQSYEDIEKYYQTFTTIDNRDDQLIKYVCASLVITGKYYLQRDFKMRAIELLNKAAITAGGRTKILKDIITTLMHFDLAKEAQEYLKRFPAETQKTPEYLALDYIITDKLVSPSISIDKGRKLIQAGVFDPEIYKILIMRAAQAGLKDPAENFMHEAIKKWPDQKDDFLSALKKNSSEDSDDDSEKSAS